MDLSTAKQKFVEFTANVKPEVLRDFIEWIQEAKEFEFQESSDRILSSIAAEIRDIVPFEAVLPSEHTVVPEVGINSDCNKEVTLHVDSFLHDDEYLDDLVDAGKFSRNYCNKCGSRTTTPFTFISHSSSQPVLKYIFKQVLPDLSNRTLVDVGSRLGPVLYAAYLYSSCPRIIGIEINKDLCEIQRSMIDKFEMSDRISLLNDDVLQCSSVLELADVIIMNNVFEFFTDNDKLVGLWKYIINTLKGPGKVLVTVPGLDESLEPLGISDLLQGWVEEIPLNYQGSDDDIANIHLYKILS